MIRRDLVGPIWNERVPHYKNTLLCVMNTERVSKLVDSRKSDGKETKRSSQD
jgi:hypothetical protein